MPIRPIFKSNFAKIMKFFISKLKTIISVFPGQAVHVLMIHRCVSYHSMSVHLPDINNLQLGVARLSRAKVFLNDLIFITATVNQ